MSNLKVFTFAFLAGFVFLSKVDAGPLGHQIGKTWGKKELTREVLLSDEGIKASPFILPVAEATAWLTHPTHTGGRYIGSAFLLGVFEGKYVMATNSHLVHEKMCSKIHIEFFFLEGRPIVTCKEVVIRDEDLDFALLIVDPGAHKDLLATKGINFSYGQPLVKNTKLFTVGFSHLKRPPQLPASTFQPFQAFLTQDEDCRIVSSSIEIIRNPKRDSESFKPRHSYSFANSCDAFKAGDCGAVYVEEETGKIIGMYWSEGTEDVLDITGIAQSSKLWTHFTYGVPASKIRKRMLESRLATEPEYKSLFRAVFDPKQ